jgi:hypothetical protein
MLLVCFGCRRYYMSKCIAVFFAAIIIYFYGAEPQPYKLTEIGIQRLDDQPLSFALWIESLGGVDLNNLLLNI